MVKGLKGKPYMEQHASHVILSLEGTLRGDLIIVYIFLMKGN